MRFRFLLCGLVALGVSDIAFRRVLADTIIYDNGPVAVPTSDPPGLPLANLQAVSNSFILPSTTTLTGGMIPFWVNTGWGTVATVQWSIGTTPFETPLYTGVASLSMPPYSSETDPVDSAYHLYDTTFSFSSPCPTLAAGTPYWFTLSDLQGISSQSGELAVCNWAQWAPTAEAANGGAGVVNWYSPESPPAESFQLDGTSTPEPSTLTLLGSALLGLGVVYLRRRKAKA